MIPPGDGPVKTETDTAARGSTPVPGVALDAMKPQDGMWLQDVPENLMIVNSVFTLETIDLETLRRVWSERVMAAGDGQRYRRFRKRVVFDERGVHWQDDPDFDVARHVFEAPGAAEIDSKAKLQRYIGAMASEPLPADRPLWQMQLIPQFAPGLSAAVFRIHHCMADGIAMIPVMFSIMDRDDPAIEKFANPTVEVGAGKSGRSKWKVRLAASLAGGPTLVAKMLALKDKSLLHGPECVGEKRVAWSGEIDLEVVKEVKNALGATVNDVLMACVAGAFERYALEQGGEELKRLRVSMPVNVRWPDEPMAMENRFATVLLKLPTRIPDVRERVLATKRRMDRLKRSVEPMVMFGAQNVLLHLLPSRFGRRLVNFFGNKTTCVLTNVPGPQVPLSIAGRRVSGFVFWVPQRDRIGIGISILSFSGAVRVGVIGDAAVLEDPGALVKAFEAELAALRAAARPERLGSSTTG